MKYPGRLGLLLLVQTVAAVAQPGAAERLKTDLLSSNSATMVLGQWCAAGHLADPPAIKALRDRSEVPASAQTRALLKAGADEPVRYRRVKLVCGNHVLSEADNWYLPARLTPQMNQVLDTSDTPFGLAVKALDFHRTTLDAQAVNDPRTILRVRALLLTPDGTPFSLVVENYTRDLEAPAP